MIKSIARTVENEIIINKSRFIGILEHVTSVDEVKMYLELYKEKYPNATHYCYAYQIGEYVKASDDGEPSKTAGMPMLNVLQKQEIDQVLVIVIRYFGGIKLGAGGLVRAYSQSVSEALLQAKIEYYQLVSLYEITFDYTYIKLIDYYIKTMSIKTIDKKYDLQVTYTCFVEDESFFVKLQEATANQVKKKYLNDEYVIKEVPYV